MPQDRPGAGEAGHWGALRPSRQHPPQGGGLGGHGSGKHTQGCHEPVFVPNLLPASAERSEGCSSATLPTSAARRPDGRQVCPHFIFFTGNLPGHPEAGPCQGEPNGDNHRLPPPVHARRRRGWVASWPSAMSSLWLEQATAPAARSEGKTACAQHRSRQSSLFHFVSVPCVLPQTSCSGQWRATNAARRRTSSRQFSGWAPPGFSCDTLVIRSSSHYSPAAAGGGARRIRQGGT